MILTLEDLRGMNCRANIKFNQWAKCLFVCLFAGGGSGRAATCCCCFSFPPRLKLAGEEIEGVGYIWRCRPATERYDSLIVIIITIIFSNRTMPTPPTPSNNRPPRLSDLISLRRPAIRMAGEFANSVNGLARLVTQLTVRSPEQI